MHNRLAPAALAACVACLLGGAPAGAQPLGTFTWQLQPFCNVVTVNVAQQGAVYTMDGYDDQCGASRRAPIVGLGTANPDGSIGLGWNIVTTPGARGVQVDARITLPSYSGSWSDSAGNAGTLALGANAGGSPRRTPPGLQATGGFLAGGTSGVGSIPASGGGTRMMWHPGKAAFRAGSIDGAQWDDARIGLGSTAIGTDTTASGASSTAMGSGATASAFAATASGGNTTASGQYSTAMGHLTTASGDTSTAMGGVTRASGRYSSAMGFQATAGGDNSTAIGTSLSAAGGASVVMGVRAATSTAAHGSFVYGDQSTGQSGSVVTSNLPNQFLVRASGGVVFWSSPDTTYPASPGVALNTNASAWSSLSDANSKENFRDLADDDVLARIARMPVREWNYKAQGAAIRHLGPTAQDFRSAFGLGEDPLRISTIDADGVALAGVRALEARTRELNDKLTREIEQLRALLSHLESLIAKR